MTKAIFFVLTFGTKNTFRTSCIVAMTYRTSFTFMGNTSQSPLALGRTCTVCTLRKRMQSDTAIPKTNGTFLTLIDVVATACTMRKAEVSSTADVQLTSHDRKFLIKCTCRTTWGTYCNSTTLMTHCPQFLVGWTLCRKSANSKESTLDFHNCEELSH